MFLSRLLSVVPEIVKPLDIPQMLLEQKETLRKLDLIKEQVTKLKVKNMYDASNTLQNPIFDMSNVPLVDKAERFFDYIDATAKYLTHPILIVNAIAGASYWVCLMIGIGGILFYVIGHEKGLKYTTGSVLSYTLIQAINWGLNLL
ncbi:hypothetical protein G9F72_018880 [Clostridium estertheticum]|uniref:hypothetical protein n=1 Tax=Clostridium estertheticum TaxID=238834 RepID=UPI0013E97727|nr:hypothetical protein [Clostridium estertheticum]MBZ9688398.1 hypothetical protein [Clostridium estertheticum]